MDFWLTTLNVDKKYLLEIIYANLQHPKLVISVFFEKQNQDIGTLSLLFNMNSTKRILGTKNTFFVL